MLFLLFLNSIVGQYNIIAKFGTFFMSHPIYMKFEIFWLHPFLYLLAWWDWPLTQLVNHCRSVL